jgi:cytochrome c-type biogenesis protein CcmH/NrfG
MILSDKKDYDPAQAALEKATKLKPDFGLAWNRLGRVEVKRGRPAEGVAAGERARKLEPKNAAFAADLCRAFFEKKEPARAVAECRAAVELDPKNPLARYELGKALVAQGDCKAARAELARFKALPGIKPEAAAQADGIAAVCGQPAGK